MGAAATVDLRLMRAAALLDHDPAAAGREAAQILADFPGHGAATLLFATARRSCGDDPAAAIAFAELAAAQPESALLQLELGRTHAAQGRAEAAVAALERAVALEPRLAEAWRELAALYAARGDDAACDSAYAEFLRLANPEQHLGEASSAFTSGRYTAAAALLKRRLAEVPGDVAAMRLLANVAAQQDDYVTAERLLGECLRLAPGYYGARHDLARVLHSQQKAQPMLPLLERLLAYDPKNLQFRSLQSSAYSLLGHNDRATAIISSLIADFPDDESVWMSYGHQFRIAGRLADAIAAYRRATELAPEFGEAWYALANLKTFRFTADDIAAMQAQLARSELGNADRLHFEFALGKAFEDTKDYESSFAHYARGNSLRRASVSYDESSTTQFVERSETLFTPEFFASRAGGGCPAADPIFIIGLPRSGSTLLEQILASHSLVEGTRELPDVPGFALELGVLGTHERPPSYPQSLAALSPADLAALGERYLAQTRPHRIQGRRYFIDKMPNNFLHVGLIQLILPNARIVDARRSPLGCCFANFKQHFQSGVWFSYSLRDVSHYYRDYVRLMAHFDAVLPGRVHRVVYENLVTDFDSEVRRLLDYCGLPFEEQCLRFYETRRSIQTVSSEQVRTPLYGDGVDQWRHYEPWLGELKEALGDLVHQQATPPLSIAR